jgi:hypothetical protein
MNLDMRPSVFKGHVRPMSEWLIFGAIVACLWGALFLIWLGMKRRGG